MIFIKNIRLLHQEYLHCENHAAINQIILFSRKNVSLKYTKYDIGKTVGDTVSRWQPRTSWDTGTAVYVAQPYILYFMAPLKLREKGNITFKRTETLYALDKNYRGFLNFYNLVRDIIT